MSNTNADVKKIKRDSNNFISIILNKITLAKNFHQRVALAITSRRILNHITLKFYLRRRYKELYLCIRPLGKFATILSKHTLLHDFLKLFKSLEMESTQGHYKGWILKLTDETNEDLINLLKLIAVLSHPKNFYSKETKIYKSFFNYPNTSAIPIHIRFTRAQLLYLRNIDLIRYLYTEIKPYVQTNTNTNTSITTSTKLNTNR